MRFAEVRRAAGPLISVEGIAARPTAVEPWCLVKRLICDGRI